MRRSLAILVAAIFFCLSAGEVRAAVDASPAAAVTALVAEIDATPDWSAHFLTVASDPATQTATVSGLTLASEHGGFTVTIDSLTLVGLAVRPDGGFSVQSLRGNGGKIEFGDYSIALSDIALTDVSVPGLAAVAYDPARPFTSFLKAYGGLARTAIAGGTIRDVTVTELIEGISSRVSYANLAIDGMGDGRIKALRAGPLTVASPAEDSLVDLTVGTAETTDIDLGAILRVLDPDTYVGGAGDLAWHSAIGHAAYRDAKLKVPGVTISIGGFGYERFSVRQPKTPIAGYFDRTIADPDAHHRDDPDFAAVLSTFGVGRIGLDHLSLEANGIQRFVLAGVHVAGLSIDALSDFAFEGLDAAIEEEGSIKIGKIAVANALLPGADALVAAYRAFASDGDVNFSSLVPSVGRINLAGIDVEGADMPKTGLDSLDVDLKSFVGRVPTAGTVALSGLEFPSFVIPSRKAGGMLAALGYDRVRADGKLDFAWNEADQTVAVKDIDVNLADMARLTGDFALSGVTRSKLDASSSPGDALSGVFLTGGTLALKDQSLVDRGLKTRAASMNVDPEKLRKQLASALPFMLAFLGNKTLQQEVAPVLKGFLLTPGTITAHLAPTSPVPLSTIVETAGAAPQKLPEVLGVSLTGDAPAEPLKAAADGAAVPDAATDPSSIRRTIDPSDQTGGAATADPTPAN